MKVFVATDSTQGSHEGDYCWTSPGELVRFPGLTCDCPGCGCDRGVAGLASSRATTTFMVAEVDTDRDRYRQAFVDAMTREGWITDEAASQSVVAWADDHLEMAAGWPCGVVLGIRDERLYQRGRVAG